MTFFFFLVNSCGECGFESFRFLSKYYLLNMLLEMLIIFPSFGVVAVELISFVQIIDAWI